jgi:hypothetical protein
MYVRWHEAQQTAADGVFRTSRRPTQENKEGRTTPACNQQSQVQNTPLGYASARPLLIDWPDGRNCFFPSIGPRG